MKKLRIILQSKLFYLLIFIFIVIYIFFTTQVIKYEPKTKELSSIEGVVTKIDISSDKVSFIIKNEELIKCNYYLKDGDTYDYTNLLGKKVKVTGKVRDIDNNTIPNTFNYKKYLYNNRIYLNYNVNKIEIVANENIFYNIKNKMINRINSLDELEKIYLNLFIFGSNDYLNDKTYNNYLSNGIWHLFAVSGMHINLIILVLDKLLKRARFKNVITSIILLYFMFLTGASASVQRVCIFFFLKNILSYFNIELDTKKILFITAFIILLIEPFMLYNVGFQYSFLISLSIILNTKNITGNYFKKVFKISLISFLISMPISINMNYEINLLSIILNVFYVPFITFILFPLSIITFIIPFITPILEVLIVFLETSNDFFYNLRINLVIPKMSFVLIALYYFMVYLYYKIRKKKYILGFLGVIVIHIIISKLDNNYYLYYLDQTTTNMIQRISHLFAINPLISKEI